ncbi:MAG: pilin [Parcubacteria group bacterium]|jgi:hypothetical protein
MKRNKIFTLIAVLFFLLFWISPAYMADYYVNQEKIPGAAQQTGDVTQYVKDIVNFGFAVIGILAMFMLMIGAYQYLMAAGNIAKVDHAKTTISSALLGLIIGICSWVLLRTINPDLVNPSLQVIQGIGGTSGGGGTALTSDMSKVKCDTVRNYNGFMNKNWSDLRSETNINSAEDLRNALQGLRANGNGLTKYSDTIYQTCKDNNVPLWYAIATMSYESNMFNDKGCAAMNNPGCVHDPKTDKPRNYATPEEGIKDNVAVMKSNMEKYSTPLETWNAWFWPDRNAENCGKASEYLKTFPWAAKATGLSGV